MHEECTCSYMYINYGFASLETAALVSIVHSSVVFPSVNYLVCSSTDASVQIIE